MKVEICYATLSKRHPRFWKELEFKDDQHLQNYIAKATREGKKIIQWIVVSDPCVWVLPIDSYPESVKPSLSVAKRVGIRYSIPQFEKKVNQDQIDLENSFIYFENIKTESDG